MCKDKHKLRELYFQIYDFNKCI
uniref:Uncharacterized protein n=1 Tax=Anguilla anguilla TaxID=7936 RepID=A0A0E9RTD2_ANGAN